MSARKRSKQAKFKTSINEKGEVQLAAAKSKKRRMGQVDESDSSQRLIVVLEHAPLEIVKNGKHYELLNADDHLRILQRNRRDLSLARPDIVHQCLLNLLDSPLNRAGLLQVFIHTANNTLIEVNPETRIPRTFKRFAGVMVQLLHERKIRAADTGQVLLRVVKNPVTQYLPAGAIIYETSMEAERCQRIDAFVAERHAAERRDKPAVFVLGAFAKGFLKIDYAHEKLSFSKYPLSAAIACTKVASAYEKLWDVL